MAYEMNLLLQSDHFFGVTPAPNATQYNAVKRLQCHFFCDTSFVTLLYIYSGSNVLYHRYVRISLMLYNRPKSWNLTLMIG